MSRRCCVENCPSKEGRKSKLGFFSIPKVNVLSKANSSVAVKTQQKRNKWLAVIDPSNRLDLSCVNLVCSNHFVSGTPSDDCEDIDWVPSLLINNADPECDRNIAECNVSNSESNMSNMDENVHSCDPLSVVESNLECNTTDVEEGQNEHCYNSLDFMKSEILKMKMECEMLKTDKIALLDQLEKSSKEHLVLLQKVENLEMTNRNLKVEIEHMT